MHVVLDPTQVLMLPAFPVSALGTVVNKRAKYSYLRLVEDTEKLTYRCAGQQVPRAHEQLQRARHRRSQPAPVTLLGSHIAVYFTQDRVGSVGAAPPPTLTSRAESSVSGSTAAADALH